MDLDAANIDMKSLLEEVINKAIIHSVPNIKQALLVKNPDIRNGYNKIIKTDGVNFLVKLQLSKLYSLIYIMGKKSFCNGR